MSLNNFNFYNHNFDRSFPVLRQSMTYHRPSTNTGSYLLCPLLLGGQICADLLYSPWHKIRTTRKTLRVIHQVQHCCEQDIMLCSLLLLVILLSLYLIDENIILLDSWENSYNFFPKDVLRSCLTNCCDNYYPEETTTTQTSSLRTERRGVITSRGDLARSRSSSPSSAITTFSQL